MKRFLILFVFCFTSVVGVEYIYPVCLGPEKDTLLVLYQQSPHHVELWQWNCRTGDAQLALLTRFSPAGIALLPDKSGFSFIDNGTVKIKSFMHRSPKTIPFDEPLYDIRSVNWIDDDTAVVSAQRGTSYGIFCTTQDGVVSTILHTAQFDYLYPQVAGSFLYYVCRNRNTDTFSVRRRDLQGNEGDQELRAFDFQPIAFLHMVDEKQGFVLGHPLRIQPDQRIITFGCYRLESEGQSGWRATKLFTFDIPTGMLLLDTSMRLYESMLPLLPRYTSDYIYFSHYVADRGAYLRPYWYSLQNKRGVPCPIAWTEQHYFAPSVLGNNVYFGGSLDEYEGQGGQGLVMDAYSDPLVKIHFPFIPRPG